MSIDFNYKPEGKTLKDFMKSNDFFRGLRGPVGSGKSVSCCIELFRRALLQEKGADGKRKSRSLVIKEEISCTQIGCITYIPNIPAKYKILTHQ